MADIKATPKTLQILFDPTREVAHSLEYAFEVFNTHLFGGQLPETMIVFSRKARTLGHFANDRYEERQQTNTLHEIALNPDYFADRSLPDILSTLAHEMCHLWQHTQGKPSRNGYHNRQWADKMLDIGLQPVRCDGTGKQTGQALTHDIVLDGPFSQIAASLIQQGWCMNWQTSLAWRLQGKGASPVDGPQAPGAGDGKKSRSKTKFTCPDCGLNAWAKKSALLLCGQCRTQMLPPG